MPKVEPFIYGGFVHKTARPIHNDLDSWRRRLDQLMEILPLPAFVCFTRDGYITRFIDGYDLDERPVTDPDISRRVAKILLLICEAALAKGFVLTDVVPKNFRVSYGGAVYLLDYDWIMDCPDGRVNGAADRVQVFQDLLDWVNIRHTFDGELDLLAASLRRYLA